MRLAVHIRDGARRLAMACVLVTASGWTAPGAAQQSVHTGAQPEARKPDVHFVPTPMEVVDRMLELTRVGEDDIVYDLGCGDGRIVIAAAQRSGARGLCVDIDPERIREGKENAAAARVTRRIRFLQDDLFEIDLSDATVVTLYLLPELNLRLRPKLFAELRPGTRIASHAFGLGDWEPDSLVTVKRADSGEAYVYFWVLPADVAGTWQVTAKERGRERRFRLKVEQQYQEIHGAATLDGRTVPLRDAQLTGDRIVFTVTDSSQGRPVPLRFTGRVTGDEIAGTMNAGVQGDRSPWTAARLRGSVSAEGARSASHRQGAPAMREYEVPPNSHPHDVAAAEDGGVWYTAQASGELGWLDPKTGETRHVELGEGSAPHGVMVGPDGAAWITDGGLNAIVRVDSKTREVRTFSLPKGRENANLNTLTFDRRGVVWFTGQAGVYGRVDPKSERVEVFDAPGGRGPYGITTTPDGEVYYASLAGSHIARIDVETGAATRIEPPTPGQGARRVWSDSEGRIWVSEWNAGQVGMYDSATEQWREWKLPGENPQAYAVYVDERDIVWLSDFGANALVSFNPDTEKFESFPLPSPSAAVRQIHGRPGEVWAPESGANKIVVLRTGREKGR